MRPGEKVRFLHSTGEGIVRKIIDNKTVEVEIEDGFLIPALRSELVAVHSQETTITGGRIEKENNFSELSDEKIWFAFVPFNEKIYSIYVVNDSQNEILFTVGEEKNGKYSGVYAGILKDRTSVKITDASIADFDKWPEFIFQGLYFNDGITSLKEPIFKRFRFKANSFFKSKQSISIINKEAYAFRLDEEQTSADPQKIVEQMFNKAPEPAQKKSFSKPAKEIDLHIENLVNDFSKMSNAEILEHQLKTFEKNLDNAIAMGMEEIIFIHGVGNGILKDNIHKYLSKNKNIQFFQDAQKGKFGYGATLVRIK